MMTFWMAGAAGAAGAQRLCRAISQVDQQSTVPKKTKDDDVDTDDSDRPRFKLDIQQTEFKEHYSP